MSKANVLSSALEIAQRYVGQRETEGKNRSRLIDALNVYVGIPLGSPYCAAGICFCFGQAHGGNTGGKNRGKLPFPKTGGSQAIKAWAKKHQILFTDAQRLKKCKGAIFGWTNADGIHGHVGFVAGRLTSAKGVVTGIRTVEFNSNSSGSRDGEGVVENGRSVPVDRGHKLWFVDTSDVIGGDFGFGVIQ